MACPLYKTYFQIRNIYNFVYTQKKLFCILETLVLDVNVFLNVNFFFFFLLSLFADVVIANEKPVFRIGKVRDALQTAKEAIEARLKEDQKRVC